MKLIEYIAFGRIHTAGLTMAGIVLGYLLAGGTQWQVMIMLALYALTFHYAGFGTNNLLDYWHDKKDAHKIDFPLIKGSVSYRSALIGVLFTTMLSFVLIFYIIMKYAPQESIMYLIILVLINQVFGLIYNSISKYTCIPSVISICLSFSVLPVIGWFMATSTISYIIVMLFIATIFLMAYQIGVSGYYKDIQSDPVSILRKLGCYVDSNTNRYHPTEKAMAYAVALKLAYFIVLYLMIKDANPIVSVLTIAWFFVCMFFVTVQNSEHEFVHKNVTRYCSLIEVVSYFALITVLSSYINIITSILLALAPFVWFVIWNKIFYGWWLQPKV